MGVLNAICDTTDLRRLDTADLVRLAQELRDFLVEHVCDTGGHLGPNLGVVELTIALHRVFESPQVPIVFDTGHQSYVHKILTGRRDGFDRLRKSDGLSGYPSRAESVHDHVENSHASTALSYADGLSRAFAVAGTPEREVVAVIGDGALTGGIAWEGLNNLGASERPVVVVLNDNGRSYSPTVGGLPHHLHRLADRSGYREVSRALEPAGVEQPGTARVQPDLGGMFGELGLDYVGPVDGHSVAAVEAALRQARGRRRPVVVHCLTEKGRGYRPAEEDEADHLHTVGVVDRASGRPATPGKRTWTDAFADTLVSEGASRSEVVAVSAAMLGPTGLQRFADAYPDRCFDVGIAEQHAVTTAAGMAMGGMHPVVALYATFANRAFDQNLLDVGLHRLPVTLVLDRAGVTGPDGASHHGMWDLAALGIVPGIRIAAPRDAQTVAEELAEALDVDDGPSVVRFPKAPLGPAVPALERVSGVDVLHVGTDRTVLLVAAGPLAAPAVEAARALAAEGIGCTVVDPRWLLPVNPYLLELAAGHGLVVTVEDGIRDGGVGSRMALQLADRDVRTPVRCLGLPSSYLPHGGRAELLARYGLDATGLTEAVRAGVRRLKGDRPLRLVPSGGRAL